MRPLLQRYLITRDETDRIDSFIRLPNGDRFTAWESTLLIINGRGSARTSGVISCTGIAIVDTKRPSFSIIHTYFPDDIDSSIRFALGKMRSKPGDIVIGVTGMKNYFPETIKGTLAYIRTFGRIIYDGFGSRSDIGIDYQRREIFTTTGSSPIVVARF